MNLSYGRRTFGPGLLRVEMDQDGIELVGWNWGRV